MHLQRLARGWKQRKEYRVSRLLANYCARRIQRAYRHWRDYQRLLNRQRVCRVVHSADFSKPCTHCLNWLASCVLMILQAAVKVIESFWIARK